jgi:hypothetical protein
MNTTSADALTLSEYLRRDDWTRTASGDIADVWTKRTDQGSVELAFAHQLQRGSFEWSDALRRIALARSMSESAVARDLAYSTLDGVRFRIANEGFIGETVPLHAGTTLLTSAQSMLRASATTAQRPRMQIGSGYSKIGDEYIRRARMAHTEQGSFVVPVYFEHDEVVAPNGEEPLRGTEVGAPESPQRRIVRTLAQTLGAYKKAVIAPGKEVRQSALTSVVAAGGSRELFASLERVIADSSVAEFETRFSWGVEHVAPGNAPAEVIIPSAALDLVQQTVRVLTSSTKRPERIFTGPVVAIEHDPGDKLARIAIQSPATNGKLSRIYMRVRATQLGEISEWMVRSVTATVSGVVERQPGRPLELRGIAVPQRLDEGFVVIGD